jgi:hypothetical protein
MEELEESAPLYDDQVIYRRKLMVELQGIRDDEELYWFKRSHETWLLKGDNNTNFFHRIANGRKRKHTTFALYHRGKQISGNKKIRDHATEFYKCLFGHGTGDAFELDENLWPKSEGVTAVENESLVRPFDESEMKSALDQMEQNKPTGPDGFPIEFYQKC